MLIGIITSLCVCISGIKTVYFEKSVLKNRSLYTSAVVHVLSVENVYAAATQIRAAAESNHCSIVVFLTDNRTLGYATGAVNDKAYISYNAFYDRRSAVYMMLKEKVLNEQVLFVETDIDDINSLSVKKITGDDLIHWIKANKNLQRYPEYSSFYITQ